MEKIGKCPICGESFEKRAANQKYCSQKCINKSKHIVRNCKVCGKRLEKEHKYRGFCSDKCKKIFFEQRRQMNKVNKSIRKCHDCGKPTTDYRCAECWKKVREKMDQCSDMIEDADEYTVRLDNRKRSE